MRYVTCILLLLGSTGTLLAQPSGVPIGSESLDVEYTVGSGANTSYTIIDFDGASFAFGYQYDKPVTTYDMLQAIDAGGDLDFTASNFGTVANPNFFIDSFSYQGNQLPALNPPENFWSYWIDDTYDGSELDFVPPVDPNNSNFFLGISQRIIADMSFDGFAFPGFDPNTFQPLGPPSVPTSAVNEVPEPTSLLAMLICGAIALFGYRLSRRRAF